MILSIKQFRLVTKKKDVITTEMKSVTCTVNSLGIKQTRLMANEYITVQPTLVKGSLESLTPRPEGEGMHP